MEQPVSNSDDGTREVRRSKYAHADNVVRRMSTRASREDADRCRHNFREHRRHCHWHVSTTIRQGAGSAATLKQSLCRDTPPEFDGRAPQDDIRRQLASPPQQARKRRRTRAPPQQ